MFADSNPDRIPRILGVLTEYWTKNPGMRLCQIISNIGMREGTMDPFFITDDVTEKRLKELLEESTQSVVPIVE